MIQFPALRGGGLQAAYPDGPSPACHSGSGVTAVRNSSNHRAGVQRWLVAVIVITVACAMILAVKEIDGDVFARLGEARLDCIAAAVGLCILYRLINSTGWVFVLRALGHPMPLARGARIWITAETMRWLPGSVWGFVSRVYQAGKAGASPTVAAASLPLELLLTIAAWAIAAGAALYGSGLATEWLSLLGPQAHVIIGAAIGAVAAMILVLACARLCSSKPGAERPSDPRRARFLSRGTPSGISASASDLPPSSGRISALREQLRALSATRPRPVLLAFTLALYTALCALNGVAFYLVLRALTDAPLSLPAAIGANACGWLAGFFAIGVPGGIGVREAASAAVLSTSIPVETVVAAAVLWRLVLIADELCCLGVLLAPAAWKRLVERPRPASALAADLRGPQP